MWKGHGAFPQVNKNLIKLLFSYLEFIQSGSCEEPRPSPAKEGHRHTKVVVNETSVEFITVRVEDYDAEPVKV